MRFLGLYEYSLENSPVVFIVMEYLPLGSLNYLMDSQREFLTELDLLFM